jgi:tRNA A-37 threonylcarbamoyl transferase component Bud32
VAGESGDPHPEVAMPSRIRSFDYEPGTLLAGKYVVDSRLGRGWEGEVYLVKERSTGIERSAKLFFPQRNQANRTVRFYAKKLHKLRECTILIQYHTQEQVEHEGLPVTMLVSDYVEGELLAEFLKRQPGRRMGWFQGLHLLHGLAAGIEAIHDMGEYHGDLHDENIIINRRGVGFEIKLLDMFHWGRPSARTIRADVRDLIRIFYDAIGGQRRYAKHPPEIKDICCGLKASLIHRKFVTAGELRRYLETMEWYSR